MMSINMVMRIITGTALLLLTLLIGYFHNLYLMWGVLGVVYLIALSETINLIKIKDKILIYSISVVIWLATLFIYEVIDLIFLAMIFLASIIAYNKRFNFTIFFPLIYPTISMIYIFKLYDLFGIDAMLWLLIIVALTDIGAYAVGKSIGKTQFSITSPNKTLEGVIGGVLIASIFGSLFGIYVMNLSIFSAILIALLTSKASIFGDLFESLLKRNAGVKDSGNLLPAHGGILDRIDGYLFGGVIMFILLKGLMP